MSDPILSLLRSIPETWQKYETNQTRTWIVQVGKLVCAGLVEYRGTLLYSALGSSEKFQFTDEFTGPLGLSQSMEPLGKAMHKKWGDSPRESQNVGDFEFRLTEQGKLACDNIAEGHAYQMDYALQPSRGRAFDMKWIPNESLEPTEPKVADTVVSAVVSPEDFVKQIQADFNKLRKGKSYAEAGKAIADKLSAIEDGWELYKSGVLGQPIKSSCNQYFARLAAGLGAADKKVAEAKLAAKKGKTRNST